MQADLASHTFRELTDPDYTTFLSPLVVPASRSGCRHRAASLEEQVQADLAFY